jgi:hypothetical protein
MRLASLLLFVAVLAAGWFLLPRVDDGPVGAGAVLVAQAPRGRSAELSRVNRQW